MPFNMGITELEEMASRCRINIIKMIHKAQSGHPGGSLSAINGIGTEDLTITKLIQRIEENEITEVVLALSTTIEGQTTTHVIAEKIEDISDLLDQLISQ